MRYTDIQNEAISRYGIHLDPCSACWGRTHAHIRERRICKWHAKNSAQATFELLHEIGHCETTTARMRRCEAEFYATQWAIDRCREYGVEIPAKTLELYQNYILREYDRGIRRGGALPPKNRFKLRV